MVSWAQFPRNVIPVVLSGGAGVRLWPISRESYPKQLWPLVTASSMLQETVKRLSEIGMSNPILVCNREHRFMIAEQLRRVDVSARAMLLEPVGRNTGAAIAVAALVAADEDPDALLLVLPSDHVIRGTEAFGTAVGKAAQAAAAGRLITFGVRPTKPATGYGYIKIGAALPGQDGVHAIDAFVEKPQQSIAEGYIASGQYVWNSGMFLFPARLILEELERFEPAIPAICKGALQGATDDLGGRRLDAATWTALPSISIDCAVMERTNAGGVVLADFDWADVGSWAGLWDACGRDDSGNALIGDVVVSDTRNSYIRSERPLVAALGLEDIVVVATDDAVLVASKAKVERVKVIVESLKKAGRTEPVTHPLVYRPWGSFVSLHHGDRFQVKRLTVNPGARISLQKHRHRAEHWIVVSGTALVTRDCEQRLLKETESIDIPLGATHRLENPGDVPLIVIEVQTGSYLGEDDITRLEDTYGRA
jgi:mannose-1-phosphate guanylyltransferase/mannose-1-phosphate guanylyltransferase/mannose-6-phosphate isomerase